MTHHSDGDWQLLCGTTNDTADARVICLACAFERDPTIGALASLPLGWQAWREAPDAQWQRDEMLEEDFDLF
jgi:hypothetical protein